MKESRDSSINDTKYFPVFLNNNKNKNNIGSDYSKHRWPVRMIERLARWEHPWAYDDVLYQL
jgi:hypothetical protein